MKKGIILIAFLQVCYTNPSLAQDRIDKLSLSQGLVFAKLQDQLWGNQIYKGVISLTTINYEWRKKKNRWNQLSFTGGGGTIAAPISIRRNTGAYQIGMNYQHLRTVAVLGKSQISWAVGGGASTFIEFRVHNNYSSNNAASYDIGSALQLSNRFYRSVLLKNNKQLQCSFLIETALLTAYLRPDYASSHTEDPFDVSGLNEVSIGTITSRMRWVSIPTFFKVNMSTTLDYLTSDRFGFRMQYNWQLINAKRKLKVTSASHQIHLGVFYKFRNVDTKDDFPLKATNSLTLN